MNELVKIESRGEKQVISAKELYEKLEMDKSHWKRWAKNNIETNDFFLENIDYEGFASMANGNETKDYWITIEMAKHLCMITTWNRGKENNLFYKNRTGLEYARNDYEKSFGNC